MKRLITASVISLALLTTSAAQAAAPVRASAPVSGESELGGGLPLSALLVLLAVIAGGIFIVADDDSPDSP